MLAPVDRQLQYVSRRPVIIVVVVCGHRRPCRSCHRCRCSRSRIRRSGASTWLLSWRLPRGGVSGIRFKSISKQLPCRLTAAQPLFRFAGLDEHRRPRSCHQFGFFLPPSASFLGHRSAHVAIMSAVASFLATAWVPDRRCNDDNDDEDNDEDGDGELPPLPTPTTTVTIVDGRQRLRRMTVTTTTRAVLATRPRTTAMRTVVTTAATMTTKRRWSEVDIHDDGDNRGESDCRSAAVSATARVNRDDKDDGDNDDGDRDDES